jgi:hypothetical protein
MLICVEKVSISPLKGEKVKFLLQGEAGLGWVC